VDVAWREVMEGAAATPSALALAADKEKLAALSSNNQCVVSCVWREHSTALWCSS
jgi:hypothetical protein